MLHLLIYTRSHLGSQNFRGWRTISCISNISILLFATLLELMKFCSPRYFSYKLLPVESIRSLSLLYYFLRSFSFPFIILCLSLPCPVSFALMSFTIFAHFAFTVSLHLLICVTLTVLLPASYVPYIVFFSSTALYIIGLPTEL